MRLNRLLARATLTAMAAVCLLPASTAIAADAPTAPAAAPAIADFFDNPAFSGALLSPSGKYLAVRMGGKGLRDRLGVVTLRDNSVKVVGSFSDADIGTFDWVNDERLVYTAVDRNVGQADARYAPGLFGVNRDGGKFLHLVSRSAKPTRPSPEGRHAAAPRGHGEFDNFMVRFGS